MSVPFTGSTSETTFQASGAPSCASRASVPRANPLVERTAEASGVEADGTVVVCARCVAFIVNERSLPQTPGLEAETRHASPPPTLVIVAAACAAPPPASREAARTTQHLRP